MRLLLGEPAHPGGLALTERLGGLLGLQPGMLVLDVASGRGASARRLAQRFGCRVIGADLSLRSLAAAAAAAEGGPRFLAADAERLPFAEGGFDAVISECAYCTFPDKAVAAAELFRVLRPGGRLGLADLVRSGELPSELEGLLAWAACLGDARPLEDYSRLLESAGFRVEQVEVQDRALEELVDSVRLKLSFADLLERQGSLSLPEGGLQEARRLARAAARAVREGRLGYALIVAERPAR